jgi:hypothetical protein
VPSDTSDFPNIASTPFRESGLILVPVALFSSGLPSLLKGAERPSEPRRKLAAPRLWNYPCRCEDQLRPWVRGGGVSSERPFRAPSHSTASWAVLNKPPECPQDRAVRARAPRTSYGLPWPGRALCSAVTWDIRGHLIIGALLDSRESLSALWLARYPDSGKGRKRVLGVPRCPLRPQKPSD